MENIEYWKRIEGFSYEVSTFGRIRRCEVVSKFSNSMVGTVLNPWKGNERYYSVTLVKEGKKYAFKVHKLVTDTFLGPRPIGLVVHHIDGNSENNRLDNLGYTTMSHNARASDYNIIRKQTMFSADEIERIKELSTHITGRQLSNLFNCSCATISNILNNKGAYLRKEGKS